MTNFDKKISYTFSRQSSEKTDKNILIEWVKFFENYFDSIDSVIGRSLYLTSDDQIIGRPTILEEKLSFKIVLRMGLT